MNMRTRLGWIIAGSLAITLACAGQHSAGASGPDPLTADSLVLERTACFGFCPVYRLRIARDGAVELRWQEQTQARAIIVRNWTIPADSVKALLAMAQKDAILALPDDIPASKEYCPQRWTDAPGAVVSFYAAAWSKKITDYMGCQKVPAALRDFEGSIDSVAGISAHRPG
jgi:hypothetical protein